MTLSRPIPQPKPLPKQRDKVARRRAERQTIRDVYALVDARDLRLCRCCGVKADEHHHVRPRARKGPDLHTTANIVTACWLCHKLCQGYRIYIEGESCDGPLVFSMAPEIAGVVFTERRLAVPAHVRIDVHPRD